MKVVKAIAIKFKTELKDTRNFPYFLDFFLLPIEAAGIFHFKICLSV